MTEAWLVHATGGDSASRRKDVLTHATARVDLADVVPGEIGQTQGDQSCVTLLEEVPTGVKFIDRK